MFAEVFWRLLKAGGRLGVILPTGIYSDLGTKDLRGEFLQRGRLDLLYALQNEKRVFAAAHHAYKQAAVVATRGGKTETLRARFRMGVGDSPEAHEIPDDLLRNDSAVMLFTTDDIRKNSPKSLSLVELRSPRDLAIFRKIYDQSFRIGDNETGWEIDYAREFDSTNDSKHFPRRGIWESKGFRADNFGCWLSDDGEKALPLLQGVSINQFDPAYKAFGERNGSLPVEIPYDQKRYQPKFLILQDTLHSWERFSLRRCSKISFPH